MIMKFDDDVKKAIPGRVFFVSGDIKDQVDTNVFDVKKSELPRTSGRVGGMLASAFLSVMNRANVAKTEKITWKKMLDHMKEYIEQEGYSQHPLLSTSRRVPVSQDMTLFPSDLKGKKRALLIAIGYEGSLKYPKSSLELLKNFLVKIHKLSSSNIEILTDQPGCTTQPTHKNILMSMAKLAKASQAGDSAFVLFCGHGSKDGSMLPSDYFNAGPIPQADIYKSLICAMPKETRLFGLFDLVNSGLPAPLPYAFSAAKHDTDKEAMWQNAQFEIAGVLGLAIVGTALAIGVSQMDRGGDAGGGEMNMSTNDTGNAGAGDDCGCDGGCCDCCNECFSSLFE